MTKLSAPAAGLSQEALKLIACAAMLLDHIGALFFDGWTLRIIGRIAFPIYCFLLAEGAHHTRSPGKYALRLAIGALLSEIPFDLALFGRLTWLHQSVMLTLLLGFGALTVMEQSRSFPLKLLVCIPFVLGGDLLRTDYGSAGVMLVCLFGLTRELPLRWLWQLAGAFVLCQWFIPGTRIRLWGVRVEIELFALAGLLPIFLYSGKKHSKNPFLQWAFYLFYPLHLTALYLVSRLLP